MKLKLLAVAAATMIPSVSQAAVTIDVDGVFRFSASSQKPFGEVPLDYSFSITFAAPGTFEGDVASYRGGTVNSLTVGGSAIDVADFSAFAQIGRDANATGVTLLLQNDKIGTPALALRVDYGFASRLPDLTIPTFDAFYNTLYFSSGPKSALYTPDRSVHYLSSSLEDTITSVSGVSPEVVPIPPIPEPATWAMMLAGFGAVGFSMRRAHTRSRSGPALA